MFRDRLLKYRKANIFENLLFIGYLIKYEVVCRVYFSAKFRIKCFFYSVTVGRGVKIYGNIFIAKRPLSIIKISTNFQSTNKVKMNGFSNRESTLLKTYSTNSKIIIGKMVDINSSSILCRNGVVSIGNNVMIAPNCIVTNSDFHNPLIEKRGESGVELDQDIVICDGVWIGMNCVILKGVTIGENSIIAAGSVVSKDVLPNVIVGSQSLRTLKKI
jgi:acetyltransferase-like isoleucine patch superfamily enzyme